jgi:acylphosphatase
LVLFFKKELLFGKRRIARGDRESKNFLFISYRSGGDTVSARRLLISGRVQGVGYRDWMVEQARALGLSGWVRNTAEGKVEALIDGDEAAIEELLRACRRGPRFAEVTDILEELTEPPDDPGFHRLPRA